MLGNRHTGFERQAKQHQRLTRVICWFDHAEGLHGDSGQWISFLRTRHLTDRQHAH